MSQESPIPEPTDSESQALSAEEKSLIDSGEIDESVTSINDDLSSPEDGWEEDVWKSVDLNPDNETGNQPTPVQEVSAEQGVVEQVAEVAAESSASLTPRSRVTSSPSGAAKQATSWQRFQRYWQAEIQPALKEQTIKTLKATIRSLEFLVDRLEAKPAASLPPQSKTPWRQIRGIWGSVLGLTRSLLPSSLNRKLSDPLLSGAIAGVLLLTIWTSSSLLFRKSPTQVAIVPPTKSVPAKPTDSNKKLVPNEQPVVKPTSDGITTEPHPKQTLLMPPEKTPSAIRETIPPGSVDAAKPAPSPTPTPLPKPIPPPLKLTPEQTLIARIQDEVAEVSNQYVNGLIQSVQANFRSSLLTVKIGDGWYTLEQAQQNKLANEMLKRAQQLNFVKLELTDAQGNLLARSPVVGSEMVILQRTTSLQQTT
ncbi:hypothetical protein AB3R30_22385 [Leptolyngbyaceae cyanobacterium UHCC 1019]